MRWIRIEEPEGTVRSDRRVGRVFPSVEHIVPIVGMFQSRTRPMYVKQIVILYNARYETLDMSQRALPSRLDVATTVVENDAVHGRLSDHVRRPRHFLQPPSGTRCPTRRTKSETRDPLHIEAFEVLPQ